MEESRRHKPESEQGWFYRRSGEFFDSVIARYARALDWVLDRQAATLLVFALTVALTAWLYFVVPKGFFPQQDTGRVIGFIQADQATSFQAMQQRLDRFLAIVRADPAVEHVTGFTGGTTPEHLLSLEVLQRIHSLLRPGGLLAQ